MKITTLTRKEKNMRYLGASTLLEQLERREKNINLKKVTTNTTSTLTRKAILRLLLKDSTLMKRSKKKNLYLTANGRIRLIILRDGYPNTWDQKIEPSITWKDYLKQESQQL